MSGCKKLKEPTDKEMWFNGAGGREQQGFALFPSCCLMCALASLLACRFRLNSVTIIQNTFSFLSHIACLSLHMRNKCVCSHIMNLSC